MPKYKNCICEKKYTCGTDSWIQCNDVRTINVPSILIEIYTSNPSMSGFKLLLHFNLHYKNSIICI